MPIPAELALLRDSRGSWLIIEGPFQDSAQPNPDPSLPSIYSNSFDLADPKPWKLGQRVLTETEAAQLLSPKTSPKLETHWQETKPEPFAQVFQEIQSRIATGELEKAVPVLIHRANLSREQAETPLLTHLLPQLAQAAPGLLPYAFTSEAQGFCGLSPEMLLRVEGRKLRSVALAGTAPAAQGAKLLQDPKEIREHELVAGYLYDKLETLGRVRRHPRKLRQLGSMVHLESLFELELDSHWQAHDLIAKLHPTPALGTQPRTATALLELQQWREQLGVPPEFGAPFGLAWQGRLEILVSIRGLWWQQDQLKLPTGCGILRQSQLEKELAELQLKRNWVASQFGLEQDLPSPSPESKTQELLKGMEASNTEAMKPLTREQAHER